MASITPTEQQDKTPEEVSYESRNITMWKDSDSHRLHMVAPGLWVDRDTIPGPKQLSPDLYASNNKLFKAAWRKNTGPRNIALCGYFMSDRKNIPTPEREVINVNNTQLNEDEYVKLELISGSSLGYIGCGPQRRMRLSSKRDDYSDGYYFPTLVGDIFTKFGLPENEKQIHKARVRALMLSAYQLSMRQKYEKYMESNKRMYIKHDDYLKYWGL